MTDPIFRRFGALTPAEDQVISDVRAGRIAVLGDGTLPAEQSDARSVRSEILTFLLLGGSEDCRVPDFGVQIKGAYFVGKVTLSGCKVEFGARFLNCFFSDAFHAPALKIDRMNFQGSTLQGLYLERARIAGYLFCHRKFVSNGQIVLTGAQIDGTVSFSDATVHSDEITSIAATRCKVTDSMSFNNGFTTTGRISLIGAKIGGQLSFSEATVLTRSRLSVNAQRVSVDESVFFHKGSRFVGGIKFTGAKIGGQAIVRDIEVVGLPDNPPSVSFNYASIKDAVVIKRLQCEGVLDLTGTEAGALNDDYASWKLFSTYQIEGFVYRRLQPEYYDIKELIAWVGNSSSSGQIMDDSGEPEDYESGSFSPQPYQHLAKVLGEMGHRRDRGRVLMTLERKLRRWQILEVSRQSRGLLDGSWANAYTSLRLDLKGLGFRLTNLPMRWIVGYGYRPIYSIWWAVVIIAITAALVGKSYDKGDFAPTAAPILISERWKELAKPVADGGVKNPAEIWSSRTDEGRDYSTFSSVYYAADLFIPLVDFGQDADWAPSTTRSDWGIALHWIEPIIRALGWLITAMGAAAIGGIIRND